MAGTILVSMLVSFTLTPMLAARWFKRPARTGEDDGHDRRRTASRATPQRLEVEEPVLLSRHRSGPTWRCCGSRCGIAGSSWRPWSAAWPRCPMLFAHGQQELHPRRRLVGVPSERPGAGGHVAGGHAGADRADRPRHPPTRRRALHDRQRGRHRAAQSLPGHDLRAAGQHRRPRVTASWRSWTSCARTSCRSIAADNLRHQRQPVSLHVRRRHDQRRRPVHDRRPRHRQAGTVRQGRHGRPAQGARRGRRRFVAFAGQAAVRHHDRPPQGRRSWASRWPTSPTPCGCWWPATRCRTTTRRASSTRSTSARSPTSATGSTN